MSEVKEAPAEQEFTEEQIREHEAAMEAQRKELMAFYKKQTPFLKAQAEYEELITRIEVAKMTRLEIMYAKAQMMGRGPERPEAEPGDHERPANDPAEQPTQERTLRREQ